MSRPDLHDELRERLLDRLEQREYASLQWGFVNGAFTEDELDDEARALLEQEEASSGIPTTLTGDELWTGLESRGLLLPLPGGGTQGRRLRTRFAETVRLLFHLRQLFPGREWFDSPTLVSDYRLLRKPRLYPRRHLGADDVLARLQAEYRLTLSPIMRNALRALIGLKVLSEFQMEATARILGARHQDVNQGTIVCAGTGTGKTLAFYLPCFTEIAGLVRRDQFTTYCIALYPRNELLKDQFQTAYANARLLDSLVARPMRLAAFYGGTPGLENIRRMREGKPDLQKGDWRQQAQGYVCPYLRCPRCRGELLWRRVDLQQEVEQLYCAACREVTVAPETIVLSRDNIQKIPPDVLFTTTEMLNRSLNNRWRYAMLGIGASQRLRFVLLDEAHTYAGVSGAQNALLVRRWKRLLGYPIHFVGLSATLMNPRKFMASLVGEPEPAIESVSVGQDLEQHGWEYQLALRGDPASQTSLLSTSIQTVMLLGRMLDPLGNEISGGVFASKVFAFTDDLDVTNRFYHNLRHAENFPRLVRGQMLRQPLAFERRRGDNGAVFPDIQSREQTGQRWNACEDLSRSLDASLVIDRVSSQDSGVNPRAEVVIATASLEVGFDDDAVGAVVQHKAPRGAASFLQRKGRAGRNPKTHPWTVVVLSDFGRDRVAYQGYEQLFEPELDRTDLPIRNRYVLKMQAVFALMDYVGRILPADNVWMTLASPSSTSNAYHKKNLERQARIAEAVAGILSEAGPRERFKRYLQEALELTEEETLSLFWHAPRALMTDVFPTIQRRMENNFLYETIPGSGEDRRNPLPEFITANLFSNLLVPEVHVVAGPSREGRPDHEEFMGILQAMNQSSPGRVTRRFAVDRNEPRDHWCPPPDLEILAPTEQCLPVSGYLAAYYVEGIAQMAGREGTENLNVYRPLAIEMQRTEAATDVRVERVDNTSRTTLIWRSQFHPAGSRTVPTPASVPLRGWIPKAYFFTHNAGSPLRVQRFAIGSEGTIHLKPVLGPGIQGPRDERPVRVRFTEPGDETRSAAVGFEMDVDAVGFVCLLTDNLVRSVLHESVIDLRAPYFHHLIATDPELAQDSVFDRDWFAQVAVSIYTAVARKQGVTLREAVEQCQAEPEVGWRRKVEKALTVIFQLSHGPAAVDEDELSASAREDAGEGEHTGADGAAPPPTAQAMNRRDQLLRLLTETRVRARVGEAARFLHESPDDTWLPWLRQRMRATLGYGLLQACYEVAAEFQTAELYLDLDPGPRSADSPFGAEEYANLLWISESIAGGVGVVEEVRRGLLQDPERFFQLVENALRSPVWERLNRELRKILCLLDPKMSAREVIEAVTAVRDAAGAGIGPLNQAREALLSVLRQNEITLSHTVTNALNVRILHPTSSETSDALLRDLMDHWDKTEADLAISIEARVFAYIAVDTPALRDGMTSYLRYVTGSTDAITERQISAAVYGMLWPRGYIVRERAFDHYNPFAALPSGDAVLLERRMDAWPAPSEVRGLGPETLQSLAILLQQNGSVRLIVPESERERMKFFLLDLVATPIETQFLLGYPRIAQVRLAGGEVIVWLTLPEASS